MCIEIVSHWNEKLLLLKNEQRDLYFSEDYVKFAADSEQIPLCIICEDNRNILLFPFLRKSIGSFYDFETPYGYGGPISNTSDKDWNETALRNLVSYFAERNYLAGFIRFHPLLRNADLCRDVFTVIDDRKTIAIDTSVSEEEIWQNQISSKNRNMIRKAEKNDFVFVRDDNFEYIGEFKKLYNATMQRVSADEFYFFRDDYYKRFIEVFKNKGFLGCIKKGEEIVSAALFMYESSYGHYHLAGSNREFSSQGANNLLLWKVACEMHKEGVKHFHLGGGIDSDEENNLYKFKKSFSPNVKQFSIGKMIFNEEAYKKICTEWEKKNPDKIEIYRHHLLKYRY